MHIKSIITATLLALSPLFVDRASAIGITTVTIPGNDGSLRSYAHVTPPAVTDTLPIPIGVDRFSPIETSASQLGVLASHTWKMTNGGNGATIRGKGDVVHNAVQVGDFSIEVASELYLNFTLTEPVNFTLSYDFSGALDPGGVAHEAVHIYNVGTLVVEYKTESYATTPGNFLLGSNDVVGTPLPGTYQLNHVSGFNSVSGGEGSFVYELNLDRPRGDNHVPDAGSTH